MSAYDVTRICTRRVPVLGRVVVVAAAAAAHSQPGFFVLGAAVCYGLGPTTELRIEGGVETT